MRQDEIDQLKLALADMQRRARTDKRFLDIGILEATIAVLDDRGAPMPPLPTEVPAKGKRGRKPRTNGADVPASVADVPGR